MVQTVESLRKAMLTQNDMEKTLDDILQAVSSDSNSAVLLWDSDELVFVLLQNFIGSFHTLNTEKFDAKEAHKIKVCIDILTKIAECTNIEEKILRLQLDYYIYPFLMSSDDEAIKMSALRLFSRLLKNGVHEGIRVSEILPLLLKIIDSSSDSCQLLALETLDHVVYGSGLDYAVQTLDRFRAIDVVLSSLIKRSVYAKNVVFLKHLLKIYTRLCERNNVKMKIKEKLPEGLESKEMSELCEEDGDLKSLWVDFVQTLN